jgi:GT2 family glycosyltransferase
VVKPVDIILVNYNSTHLLLRSLGSIYESVKDLSAEVIVWDNDSRDAVERVTSMFPRVLLTRSRVNRGFAKAVNRGLRIGSAPYVVLLNPDTYVAGDFFSSISRFMAENDDVGIVRPRIIDPNGIIQDSARSFPDPFTALFGRSSLLTRWFPMNPLSRRNLMTKISDGVTQMRVDWVSGACMVVRRKAVQQVVPWTSAFSCTGRMPTGAGACGNRDGRWSISRRHVLYTMSGGAERALVSGPSLSSTGALTGFSRSMPRGRSVC